MKSDSKSKNSIFRSIKILHRGKTLSDITSVPKYNNFITTLDSKPSKLAYVPPGMEHRPDLISFAAYGNEKFWWLILLANNII